MTTSIQTVVEFTINDGKIDTFKQLGKEYIELVKANEPNMLSYQFYFNDDESRCYALEFYKDSEAVFAHLENVAEVTPRALEVSQIIRVEIFGNVSDELREAVSALNPQINKHWDGITR